MTIAIFIIGPSRSVEHCLDTVEYKDGGRYGAAIDTRFETYWDFCMIWTERAEDLFSSYV